MIIIWGADDSTAEVPIAFDFIVDNGSTESDLVMATGRALASLPSGNLVPTADAVGSVGVGSLLGVEAAPGTGGYVQVDTNTNDPIAAFQLGTGTTLMSNEHMREFSYFFLASNTPFHISANAVTISQSGEFDLSDITLRSNHAVSSNSLQMPFGSSARHGGTHIQNYTLAELNGVDIYQRPNRGTARDPGSIADQSIKFNLVYRFRGEGDDYDLSMGFGDIHAEVTYTAYVP